MSFVSWHYLLFLAVVLLATRLVRSARAQQWLLIAASCAFYGFFDLRLLPVLLAMVLVTWIVSRAIASTADEERKQVLLWLGVTINLGVLGVFKYYGFFGDIIASALDVAPPSDIGLALPLGISFVTFQVLSYLIEVRRAELDPTSLREFAVLVMFFPHLPSGPILQPTHFISQLRTPLRVSWDNVERALPGFLLGFTKKLLIADSLAPFVSAVYERPAFYDSATVWLAAIAFAIEIYCDFSGYSDIAIASARCFGIEIPANFNMPYLSKSVAEFWRRWHISLSSWFRRYVYIPLGGSRVGLARASANTMIVMLLSGLWHGAGWNFIAWGALHGLAMVVQRAYREWAVPSASEWGSRVRNVASWFFTTLFLCLTWVLFRVGDFAVASVVFAKLFLVADTGGIHWVPTALLVALPLLVLGHWIGVNVPRPSRLRVSTLSGAFVVAVVVLALLVFAPDQSSPFIYLRF